MADNNAQLSEKDRRFREFALGGNMWHVVASVCLPLMAYQGLLHIFKIFDTIMASHISTEAVSSIAYLSQIGFLISALGTGLAVGSGMKISEAYGAGDYELVKKRVSTVYAICAGLSLLILLILPFNESFLRLNGTPETMIAVGKQYFAVEITATVLNFFNTVYIAIERARGNSKLILYLNVIIIVIKLSLTAIFIYALDGDVVMIAVATLISQIILFITALFNMNRKDNLFGFSFRAITFSKDVTAPMIKTSFPVAVERAAFAFGKLIVNAMSTVYGDSTVGALGVSNNIDGISTSLQNGFQEGGASIISQNIGAGKHDRALSAFRKIMVINVIIGAFFLVLTLWQLDFISGIFAPEDEAFRLLICDVYKYEAIGTVTLGINAAVMALLYGYGYTKLTLVLNTMRIFVFRVPVLWFLQNFTDIGSESVGIVMMVSNISVGLLSMVAGFFVIRRIKMQFFLNK